MRLKIIHSLKELIIPVAVLMLLASFACTSSPMSTPDPTATPEPAAKPAPSELVPRITIEELLQKMESDADILVVDTRYKEQYDVDHIKGSVSAPLSTIIEGGWIPPSDKEVILYCG
jgi:hypothetical protein